MWVQRGFPSSMRGACCGEPVLAARGKDVCRQPCLPSCAAHTSHVSASWPSRGLSVTILCHQHGCCDCFYPFFTECNCTENGICNAGLHGDGSCFCAEGWTGERCEIRLGEGCQAPPPAIPWDPVPYGRLPNSWLVQAAGQKYLQKELSDAEICPVLLNFTRAGVVGRRKRKAPLDHDRAPQLRGAPRRA